MTKISVIATEINKIAHSFDFGKLPEIRKRLTGKNVHSMIFNVKNKSVNDEEGWAFHTGGREELQFNIGFEKEEKRFRFGVAFSLEPSRDMHDIAPFRSKIDRFNEYIRLNASDLDSFRMWIWRKNEIIKYDSAVRAITDSEVQMPNFIFLGKAVPLDSINNSEIGHTFDKLLPLYCFVESAQTSESLHEKEAFNPPFEFKERLIIGKTHTSKSVTAGLLNIAMLSNQIKAKLCEELRKADSTLKLGDEIPSGNGGKIDLVSLFPSGQYEFYEIKPAILARHAIREALPQLLEYAYRRGGVNAQRLVIVSQEKLDDDSSDFLKTLRSKGFPVYYHQIPLD